MQDGEELKWNGWGYADSMFTVNERGHLIMTGQRYSLSGVELPSFRGWIERKIGVDLSKEWPAAAWDHQAVPAPRPCAAWLDWLAQQGVAHSQSPRQRVHHSHGHTCQEIYALRNGVLPRLVDVVVWPTSHEETELVVAAAVRLNIGLIPFGGGTSVTGGLLVPETEQRAVCALSMQHMRAIKWVDGANLMACIQAGAVGAVLVRELSARHGLVLGHEPDSLEFSTLGGWIATRASGMKKNVYGNIEDLLVSVRMVTPAGTIERACSVPRISSGPDVFGFVLGSEGTLGVITEAVVKLRPAPRCTVYGALVFPDFAAGVGFMRAVARARAAPASLRLVDNNQFQMGQALKPAESWRAWLGSTAKRLWVTRVRGFDVDRMVAATTVYVGDEREVAEQQRKLVRLASAFGGLAGDAENGRRGFELTFMIAYIRDLALRYAHLGESFETSVPWSRVLELCQAVSDRVHASCAALGVRGAPFVSCRVTQLYDTGACVYFYFAFSALGLDEPLAVFSRVESDARVEIMLRGGSISHHHGVGKHRAGFLGAAQSPAANGAVRALKRELDPTNVFACGNLLDAHGHSPAALVPSRL